jgi:hypothetical protein
MHSNPAGPQKFGALYMTSALGPLITHHPTVKTEMQAFLVQHVLPSFSSSEGYLRAMVRAPSQTCVFAVLTGRTGVRGRRHAREERAGVDRRG